jgi:alpha-amylase/alpha-mannosidase (GH57 family)
MPESKKLKVAILWHMHQPFYLHPETGKFTMPWVRLHGLKDYLDMPLMAARHGVKVTFNLVPSLLDQIEMYCQGYTDRHLELTSIPARELSPEEKREILRSFFSAHHATMIEPYFRYQQLYRKNENCGKNIDLAVEIFSTAEWRDLQVWANLAWIDPLFREEDPVRELFAKGRDFTEEEKGQLIDYQIGLLKKIIPTYRQLFLDGQINVAFTPYYHPILPLLIDTNVAQETAADITLPRNRFSYPDDARRQVEQSIDKFHSLFGKTLKGMWPSEGSVSEATVRLTAECGVGWIASDEEILYHSLIKSRLDPKKFSPHSTYVLSDTPGVKLFFRDHGLSDRIGFVYSEWRPERAVNDFIQNLKALRKILEGNLENSIVPVILDGENAWEYFPEDGTAFLSRLYQTLAEHDQIELVSLDDMADELQPRSLPALSAGSWINHNFRIWIGHSEDNQAWDLLYDARKALQQYESSHPEADKKMLTAAWKQIHIAEGSDWCWWFGDEHLGPYNDEFDLLYRTHLMSVYKIIGLDPPPGLGVPIHRARLESFVTLPESLITPELDGLLTHYYEWSGAGQYDCVKAGGAMHRVDIHIKTIHFAFDREAFYIRLDFHKIFRLVDEADWRIIFDFKKIGPKEIPISATGKKDYGDFSYSFKDILEVRFDRKALTETGSGAVEFFVLLYSGEKRMEKWPFDEPISVELPERDKELFWQV